MTSIRHLLLQLLMIISIIVAAYFPFAENSTLTADKAPELDKHLVSLPVHLSRLNDVELKFQTINWTSTASRYLFSPLPLISWLERLRVRFDDRNIYRLSLPLYVVNSVFLL